ncbi:MAG: (d)CMP kinase [Verrucomicrobia bacterium]|nr:(d)CMP kinase [Verrucomicrobiota bacterium]
MAGSVIAIDGPAGSGKSTIAVALARRLGRLHVNTGAMYRAITVKVLRAGLRPDDRDAVIRLVDATHVELRPAKDGGVSVFLDGEDVTHEVGTAEVSRFVSPVSLIPEVRNLMVREQRRLAERCDVVAEGRDVTTVVYPNAQHKFYLDASPEERARRRLKEFAERGERATFDEVKREIEERDHRDSTRAVSPLTQAKDAIIVDTTSMKPDEVVDRILRIIEP